MKRLQNLPPDFIKELQKSMSIANARREAYQKKYQQMKQQSLQAAISGMQNSGLVTVYTNQVPYELDVLRTNLYEKTDMGWFIQTVLGVGVGNPLWVVGFPCNPISPPGLSVTLGPGVTYDFSLLLPTGYSVIPTDTNPDHRIYKSYILFDKQTFSTPAPVSPGDSIIYLIQVAPLEEAVNVVSRPYFNSADPSMPIFESQSDTLLDYSLVTIKPGVEAPSPTPPTPDPGFTGLYYVTVTYGQTSIVSGNITVVPGAPFITESLTEKISSATVGTQYVTKVQEQNSVNVSALDIGIANVYQLNATPAYSSLNNFTRILGKIAHSNTGASTLQVNSTSAFPIKILSPSGYIPLVGGELIANCIFEFIYNSSGAFWQLNNPATNATAADQYYSILSFINTTYQIIPPNSTALISFDNAVSDPYSFISSNGFIPKFAGWYNFNSIVHMQLPPNPNIFEVWLYKNGTPLRHLSGAYSPSQLTLSATSKEYANGTTDIFQLYFVNNAIADGQILGGTIGSNNSDQYMRFEAEFVHT